MADSMVTSDFESAHAFPVKPEIVGFRPLKDHNQYFLGPNLRNRTLISKMIMPLGPAHVFPV